MKLACLTFTKSGESIGKRLKGILDYEVDIFSKENYKQNLNNIFKEYEGIVFISSTGIAVRISTPFVKDKTIDPAIVVVDDLGKYSISLLSGHIGGANELASRIAEHLKCQAIITTASDARGIEAVDLFAKKNDLFIENLEAVKTITSMMVEGKSIKLYSELELEIEYEKLVSEEEEGAIFVTSEKKLNYNGKHCILRPRNLIIGIGCRRGKTRDEIMAAIAKVFSDNNLSLNSIGALATVDVKQDEIGIIEAAEYLNCNIRIFTREEIKDVQEKFSKSGFVEKTIGVGSVCEPCAFLSGGEIIVNKTIINGVTIAVSREVKNV
jgi:cobalt-precorrin 5A hydrolase